MDRGFIVITGFSGYVIPASGLFFLTYIHYVYTNAGNNTLLGSILYGFKMNLLCQKINTGSMIKIIF